MQYRKKITQLRYLGAARLLVFLQCSGMSVRIEKGFIENVRSVPNKRLYELFNMSTFKQLAEFINHVIKCLLIAYLFACLLA